MENIYIKLGWVKVNIIDRYKGGTYDSLKSKRQSGKLREGYHWRKSDGVIYFNFERIDKYLEMDPKKLNELKVFAKKFDGVSIHGNNIRINFYYQGTRCIESIKGFQLTKSNLKFAYNKRVAILHEIATSTFDYRNHFPTSNKVNLFSVSKNIPTVLEALENWLQIKEKTTARSTQLRYRSKSFFHIVPKWGHLKLNELSQSELKHWISLDLSNLTNKTINEIMIPFRGIFIWHS